MKPVNKPLISVIIPVHNLEKYLQEAIDSVLAQTYRHFEIIIVDDGSTDRSEEIILEYVRKQPDRIRHIAQQNQGAAAARNRGIEIAKGEWIAFLDGDDVWKPHKLERQLQIVRKRPGINFLSSFSEIYGQQGLVWKNSPSLANIKFELLLHGCFIILSTVLIKKELLHEEMFDKSFSAAHDLELFVRLAPKSCYYFINEPLIYYRRRQDSITDLRQNRYVQTSNHYHLVKREWEYLKNKTSTDSMPYYREFRQAMQRLSHEAAYAALMSEKATFLQRIKLLVIAIREHPYNLKHYRFLLQCFLPPAWNVYLSQRRQNLVHR